MHTSSVGFRSPTLSSEKDSLIWTGLDFAGTNTGAGLVAVTVTLLCASIVVVVEVIGTPDGALGVVCMYA